MCVSKHACTDAASCISEYLFLAPIRLRNSLEMSCVPASVCPFQTGLNDSSGRTGKKAKRGAYLRTFSHRGFPPPPQPSMFDHAYSAPRLIMAVLSHSIY